MKSGDFIVGADNGIIYILNESGVKQRIRGHEGPITMITYFLDENTDIFILTAGFDMKVTLWNDEMHMVCT